MILHKEFFLKFIHNRADGRAIRFRCGFQNTIYDVLKSRNGWVESPRCVTMH